MGLAGMAPKLKFYFLISLLGQQYAPSLCLCLCLFITICSVVLLLWFVIERMTFVYQSGAGNNSRVNKHHVGYCGRQTRSYNGNSWNAHQIRFSWHCEQSSNFCKLTLIHSLRLIHRTTQLWLNLVLTHWILFLSLMMLCWSDSLLLKCVKIGVLHTTRPKSSFWKVANMKFKLCQLVSTLTLLVVHITINTTTSVLVLKWLTNLLVEEENLLHLIPLPSILRILQQPMFLHFLDPKVVLVLENREGISFARKYKQNF